MHLFFICTICRFLLPRQDFPHHSSHCMHEDELLAIPLEAQEALPPKLISLNARTSVDTVNQDLHVSKLGHHFVRATDKREKIRPACRGEDKNAVRA